MYKIKLPIRYLLKHKITYLAVVAVSLCVFIVIVVMSVHRGLVTEFKAKNHRYTGDCIISTDSMVGFSYYEQFVDELDRTDFVKACAPVIQTVGTLTRAGYDENRGVEIVGINIDRHIKTTNFGNMVFYNKDNPVKALTPVREPYRAGFIAGVAMMASRDSSGEYLHPDTPIILEVQLGCIPLTAKGAMQKADTDFVNSKVFLFSDASESRLARVDGRTVYIAFNDAQILCGMGGNIKRTHAIFVKFTDGVNIATATEKINVMWNKFVKRHQGDSQADLLAGVTVADWKSYNRESIAPMEKEQTMLTILFVMVGLTNVFIVFVVFYMMISHKSKDIGIMKSLGISSGGIITVFIVFAFMIGLIGALVGTGLGRAFLVNMNSLENFLFHNFGFQVFDRTVYAIDALPDATTVEMILTIAGCAVAACVLGALVPSIQAARKSPVDALKVSQI